MMIDYHDHYYCNYCHRYYFRELGKAIICPVCGTRHGQLKPSYWPRWIIKDSERLEFAEERTGWLIYENEKHFILVGREEALSLAEKDVEEV